ETITADRLAFSIPQALWSSGSNNAIYYNGGNVGISTQNPKFDLDINGIVNATQFYRNGAPLQLTSNDIADGSIPGSKIQPGTITADRLAFQIPTSGGGNSQWTTASDSKTISYSNGNVGIGTANPQQNLSVNAGLNIDQSNANNGSLPKSGLTFGSTSGEGIASNRSANGNQYGLDFYTNSAPRISITNGGNIGMGTQSPQALLHLQAPPTPKALGGNAGNIQFFFPPQSAGSAGLDFSYDGGDDHIFGFGHYGTNQGQTIFVWHNNDKDNVLMRILNTGDVQVSGNLNVGGKLVQASSRTLKENITDVSAQEAIASLASLNPVKFNYRNDLQKETILGFIAEDVPELVATRDRKGVSPLEVVALLTKVIQEQQAQISRLSDRINALEAAA
ncbi:MAG TPA: tail fiber domain-containing protein, partial [Allocoleopsis sp.]